MTKPVHPYLVLALSIALPGAGHLAVRDAIRGFIFAFFVLFFGLLSYATTTPDQSFIGRHAGGLFIWCLSIPDAYRRARMNYVVAAAKSGGQLR